MFGVFTFGSPYFGQALPLVQASVLDLCDAVAVSLMPGRTGASLMPLRSASSLMPNRTVERHCED